MPLPTSLVGASTAPQTEAADVRSTMAFSAGIGDLNPVYLDTTREGGVVAHPLFLVGPEWPVVLEAGRLAPHILTRDEAKVGLHLSHDATIHRLVRPGDILTTTATVVSVSTHRAGAFEVIRLETVDQRRAPVTTTDFGMLFPGVAVLDDAPGAGDVRGDGDTTPTPPAHSVTAISDPPLATVRRDLRADAAHIYTECARIWNPIHTDPTAARAAGLPDIIFHGTATLAMAVSAVVDRCADGDPTRVGRIRARFGAMVLLPSTIEIRIGETHDGQVPFEVRNQDGEPAVRHGAVDLLA